MYFYNEPRHNNWSREDIKDATAIKLLFPDAVIVYRNSGTYQNDTKKISLTKPRGKNEDDFYSEDFVATIIGDCLPGLLPNERIELKEILNTEVADNE